MAPKRFIIVDAIASSEIENSNSFLFVYSVKI